MFVIKCLLLRFDAVNKTLATPIQINIQTIENSN